MTPVEKSAAYRWGILGLFTFGFSLVLVAMTSLGLLLPQISEELSLSPSEQGWLGSSVLFGNVLFSVPINWWVSRYRPWRTAAVSFLAGTIFIAIGGWAPTFAVLLIARIGLGMVQQASQSPRTLLVIQWVSHKNIGAANGFTISLVDVLMGTGLVFIPLLMGWVGGWRNTMYTWAGISLFAAILWISLGKDRETADYRRQMRARGEAPLAKILKYREVWFICLAVFGILLARMAFSNFWPTFMQDEYAIKATTVGLMMGVVSFAMAPSELLMVVLPFVARHRTTVLVLCGVSQCLSYAGLISTGSVPLLFLLSIVNGIGFGFFPLLMTMIFDLPAIKPREVAIASSVVYTVMWGGGALGPILVGFVEEAVGDLRTGLMITAFAPITLVFSALLLANYARDPEPETPKPDVLIRLCRLLDLDESALLSRLRRDESLVEIARDRGVGRRRLRANLLRVLPRSTVNHILRPRAGGGDVLTLFVEGDGGRVEGPSRLKDQPKGT